MAVQVPSPCDIFRGRPLLPNHLADLRKSGLSDEQIDRCGFFSLIDPKLIRQSLNWKVDGRTITIGSCLAIPFFDRDGILIKDYLRLKPDKPRMDDRGKSIKYESPVGQPNRLYLPPATRNVLLDPGVPLLVTEGEKKSARADQNGCYCIGLVGVEGWSVKREKDNNGNSTGPRKLIPDLASIGWTGRRVYIAYDSDRVDKPGVLSAEWSLSRALQEAGADVRVTEIPSSKDGAKQGLDDFLLAHGPDELKRLIEAATLPREPRSSTTTQLKTHHRFGIGDRVSPNDRDNIGTVVELLPGLRYSIKFVSPDGSHATKRFRESELKPPGSSTAKPSKSRRPPPPPPPRPFPVDALPPPLQEFVRSVAAAIPCDPSSVALPVLVTCAAAIGTAKQLRLKSTWTEPSVLWGAVVCRSGSVKSPPLEFATRPLSDLDFELRTKSDRAIGEHEEEQWLQADQPEDLTNPKGKSRKPRPPKRRCVAGDLTIESLVVILDDNPKGILVYRDELSHWFGSLSRYKNSDDTPAWIPMYHARPSFTDRKTGDKLTLAIPTAAASIVGTIQPKILQSAFSANFKGSGAAARMLLAMPTPTQKRWTDDELPSETSEAYAQIIRRLHALEPCTIDGRVYPVDVTFDDKAMCRWKKWVNDHGLASFEKGDEDEDIGAVYAKIEGVAGRFALIDHVVSRNGMGIGFDSDKIDLETLERAITLARWFATESERVYAVLGEDEGEKKVRELTDQISRQGGKITIRELMRLNSRRFRNKELAQAALDELAAARRGTWSEIRPPSGGHPIRVFSLSSTHDTSDTRPDDDAETENDAPDTRPLPQPETYENQAISDRASEVSCVEHGDKSDSEGDGPELVEKPSVEQAPPPRSKVKLGNRDRPRARKGAK